MYAESKIDKYISENAGEEDPLLSQLNRETHLKTLNSRMISGHLQGLFLEIISKIVSPSRILEIGTFTGYSAICLARGLKKGGVLHTIDINDELESIASKYIGKSGLKGTVQLHWGDALDIIPKLDGDFDLVFIDANKKQYFDYYNLVINRVIPGGVLLVDNVLWNEKVISGASLNDPDTKAIIDFNKMIKNDPRVENLIIPLRDGISVIRKLD